MQTQEELFFHSKRDHEGSAYFELYRCYGLNQQVLFSVRAISLGKPFSVFNGEEKSHPIAEMRNSKGYLFNGKTLIHDLKTRFPLGCYVRTGSVIDGRDRKIGRWRDARSWSDEFKGNLIDALANALLGSGDVSSGANPSDTHIFSIGKDIIATLQREQMSFFPDPPKSMEPGRLAKIASKVIPGRLGKSLGEVTPPYGWTLKIHKKPADDQQMKLIQYGAVLRIEFLRWSKA